LAGEIDNIETKLVDGDGTEASIAESSSSWTTVSTIERSDDDVGHSSQEEYPSWGEKIEKSPWPSPPATDDEDYSLVSHATNSPASGSWQSLRIITSTISSIASGSLGTVASTTAPTKHTRTSSLQHRPSMERQPSYQRAPPVTMEHVQEPAPRPLLRRSTQSHPDISSLCKDWANAGPANQTVNYKAIQSQSTKRRHSQTKSVVDLFSPITPT
jgi:hypothetical protein